MSYCNCDHYPCEHVPESELREKGLTIPTARSRHADSIREHGARLFDKFYREPLAAPADPTPRPHGNGTTLRTVRGCCTRCGRPVWTRTAYTGVFRPAGTCGCKQDANDSLDERAALAIHVRRAVVAATPQETR